MGWRAWGALGGFVPPLHPISISQSHLCLCAGLCCAYFQEICQEHVPEKCCPSPVLVPCSFSQSIIIKKPYLLPPAILDWLHIHV